MKQNSARNGDSISSAPSGSDEPLTFWSSAREIVRQTALCLKDGAASAWIVKRYVKAGKIVPFPDQWAALLESEGFRVVCRARAWLVQVDREPGLFGGVVETRKERKSFFRRLHEKKSPHTRIDFEEVIFAVKVGPGGSGDAAVSSPPFADSLPNSKERSGLVYGNARYGHKDRITDATPHDYGTTPGQLGSMKPGEPPRRCNQCGKGDEGCQCSLPEE